MLLLCHLSHLIPVDSYPAFIGRDSDLTGLFQLVDQSVTSGQQGIALCRPPGHHAGPMSSTGFCLVNNVALAARYALRKWSGDVQSVFSFLKESVGFI